MTAAQIYLVETRPIVAVRKLLAGVDTGSHEKYHVCQRNKHDLAEDN